MGQAIFSTTVALACCLLPQQPCRVAATSSAQSIVAAWSAPPAHMVLEALGFSVQYADHPANTQQERGALGVKSIKAAAGASRCELRHVLAAGAADALEAVRRAESRNLDAEPLLLTGLAKGWPALTRWKKLADFLAEHGDLEVEVGDPAAIQAFGAMQDAKKHMTLTKFLAEPHPRGHVAFFDFEGSAPSRAALLNDFKVPPALKGFGTRPGHFVFSAGHDGTGLSSHVHGDTWLTLVTGAKLWILEPPQHATWAPRHSRYAQDLVSNGRPTHGMLCVQRPGETMFVPAGWGHATVNVGLALAIGQQEPPGMVRRAVYDANKKNPHTLLRAVMSARKSDAKLRHLGTILSEDSDNVEALYLKGYAAMEDPSLASSDRRQICEDILGRLRRWLQANDPEDELATLGLKAVDVLCHSRVEL